ncbi:MAG TPA: hypothetical protein VH481_09750 [Nitrososphaeraceae archaeon]
MHNSLTANDIVLGFFRSLASFKLELVLIANVKPYSRAYNKHYQLGINHIDQLSPVSTIKVGNLVIPHSAIATGVLFTSLTVGPALV